MKPRTEVNYNMRQTDFDFLTWPEVKGIIIILLDYQALQKVWRKIKLTKYTVTKVIEIL